MLGESAIFPPDKTGKESIGFDQVFSKAPSPEFVAQLTEEYQRLFEHLQDADLRKIATLKMEGYAIDEISKQLGRAPATFERKLKVIRAVWEKDLAEQERDKLD